MLEQIILGIVQGLTEWLPISSSAVLYLVKVHLFSAEGSISQVLGDLLFLHLGTFLAALVYFRLEVLRLLRAVVRYKRAEDSDRKMVSFLLWTTFISALIGLMILRAIENYQNNFEVGGTLINLIIATALFLTAWLQFKEGDGGGRSVEQIKAPDILLSGVLQGFSAIPGLSRSGTTVSALLLRKFDKELSLKLSFLMSLPIILGANIVLNLGELSFSVEALAGLSSSFLVGFLSIDLLMRLARKINFGYFTLFFAVLTLLAAFI